MDSLVPGLVAIPIAIVALGAPTFFLSIVLLIYCGFLGFVDRDLLGIYTPENLMFMSSLASVPAIFLWRRNFVVLNHRLWEFPAVMLALYLVGATIPAVRGHSDLVLAFIEGRHLAVYLLLLYTLLALSRLKLTLLKKLIVLAGICLSLEVIAYRLFGVFPPGFLPIDPDFPGESTTIHIMYPHVISAALFLGLFDRLLRPRLAYLWLAAPVLILGVIFQGHLSITLVTLLAIAFGVTRLPMNSKKIFGAFAGFAVVGCLLVVMALLMNLELIEQYDVGAVQALLSRIAINAVRFQYLIQHPLGGYGFVHEASTLGLEFAQTARGLHDIRLATVDSGYLDLLVKFGLIGTGLVVWFFIRFCRSLASLGRVDMQAPVAFVVLYLSVLLTWSLLTYAHGIFFLVLSVLICLSKPRYGTAIASSRDTRLASFAKSHP